MKIGDNASFEKTITEFDVGMFSRLTGDLNPVHVSDIEAKESGFEKRIVHGMLVSSMISTVLGMKLPGPDTIYMEQDSKFLKPVYIGDTVRAIVQVTEIINREKGIIKLDSSVQNQNGEVVIIGYSIVKVKKGILE